MTDPLYEQKAMIYKALAHPLRVQMVEALAEGEKNVSELLERVRAKKANASRHLAILKSAGIVSTRKEGLNVYYRVAMPCLLSMLSCVDEALVEKARFHEGIARRVK